MIRGQKKEGVQGGGGGTSSIGLLIGKFKLPGVGCGWDRKDKTNKLISKQLTVE